MSHPHLISTPKSKKRNRESQSPNTPSPSNQPPKFVKTMVNNDNSSAAGGLIDPNEAIKNFIRSVIHDSEQRTTTLITELQKDVRDIGKLAKKLNQTEKTVHGLTLNFARLEADKRKTTSSFSV
jgi:hypothetical protein